ncbi:MAG: long-chain fatty acid--CoA ligase [Candidatus Rokuibacteriota bacterium]|nr:MAG: long-chain fatty acid--CoA ligase [Candidatus Rokubacteria bacterium]
MTTSLARALTVAAERVPGAEAIADDEQRLTYRDLEAGANRVAAGLARLGIEKGDHVVLVLKNRVEHVTLYWACQKLGVIATPLNWRYAEGEVRFCAEDADAVAVVFEAASATAVGAARPALPRVRHWIAVGAAAGPDTIGFATLAAGDTDPGPPAVALAETDVSIMLYTSGTTGRPKGVPRTHRAEASAALAHVVQSHNVFGERTLAAMPLYHTMGVRSMIAMALLHGSLICLPDWDPAVAARLLQDRRITALYLVPTLYHDLVSLPDIQRYHLGSVARLGYAGAPMTSTLTRRVADVFRPRAFVNHLGSTEVYTFTVCDRVMDKPTCAGRSGLFGRSRIVRADPERQASPQAVVARGETGELIVAMDSPEAFTGYWRRPDADAGAIRDGWYFTGDLAYEDEDGDIYTVGRVDDMIISGGENIYPTEVEDVLVRHPDVREACVVGLPDERLGQTVAAFVVPRHGAATLTADELDRFCRAARNFASFKRPRRYEFVAALPKSPTGKLLRRKLLQA